ncbi:unnamed protein product [Mytilus coruscus]|uniref:Uncharacterized protein n=1 Tax=Mytilus coruscus TaxID=42192 RepID=A0A6J8EW85_MYTCO|nr:unnamed protein product [Mytilus coruscus]
MLHDNPLDCSMCKLVTFKHFLQRNYNFRYSGAKCEGEAKLLIDHNFTNCKEMATEHTDDTSTLPQQQTSLIISSPEMTTEPHSEEGQQQTSLIGSGTESETTTEAFPSSASTASPTEITTEKTTTPVGTTTQHQTNLIGSGTEPETTAETFTSSASTASPIGGKTEMTTEPHSEEGQQQTSLIGSGTESETTTEAFPSSASAVSPTEITTEKTTTPVGTTSQHQTNLIGSRTEPETTAETFTSSASTASPIGGKTDKLNIKAIVSSLSGATFLFFLSCICVYLCRHRIFKKNAYIDEDLRINQNLDQDVTTIRGSVHDVRANDELEMSRF